ncbi:chemotaxis protein CheW [Pseudomonas panipatensis]|uniref:chemotaxis protein CheW n=1 Tax=Pseudomonas panipatensis TaxID=428992 RepID=UPI0035ADD244
MSDLSLPQETVATAVAAKPPAKDEAPSSLTGLLVPLSDRTLLLPNVAVAELITYRPPQTQPGLPAWYLGQIAWRDLRLPLLSFEAASRGSAEVGAGARVIVINALGGRPQVKFLALLVQGIPRSVKVGPELARADVELAPLELAAVSIGPDMARIPDLVALEQKLADAGLI